MTPFARFALVFGIVVLVVCAYAPGPLSGFGLIGGLVGAIFGVVASIVGAVFGWIFGLIGLLIALVAMVPLLIPVIVLFSPLILLVGLIAVLSRSAQN